MLERLEDELEKSLSSGAEAENLLTKLVSLLGSGNDEARAVLTGLGWRTVEVAGAKPVWRRTKEKRQRPDHAKPAQAPVNPHSPFAGLAALRIRGT
jgi:hypothetical protein